MGFIHRLLRRLGLRPPIPRQARMAAYLDQLRRTGVRIGDNVAIYNSILDSNFPFLIEIGSDTIITHATILAHDASPLIIGKGVVTGPVRIGSRCFVGAGAIIMPGVSIGDDCIVGANAVVTRDVPPSTVVAGNPASRICSHEEWMQRLEAPSSRKQLICFGLDSVVPTEAETAQLATLVKKAWSKPRSSSATGE